jgi:rare lipoprotein A
MNQRLLWTTVALLTTVLGVPSIGRTQSTKPVASTTQASPSPEVVKVGEYQSSTGILAPNAVIAKVQPHIVAGRQAVTLYIREIPVITFLGSKPIIGSEGTKVGTVGNATNANPRSSAKVATTGNLPDVRNSSADSEDPVLRATAVAARLNQINLENVDATKITVNWNGADDQSKRDRYTIKINGEKLVEINKSTILAGTTNNLAQDALQATNRIRRLLGNAAPLNHISGLPAVMLPKLPRVSIPKLPKPKLPQQISIGPVRLTFNGMASWYGPGFHGRRSANGEVYNQNALTAAHRTLPFGTQVRVTNTRNGRSVVVRINDRGPFIRGRVIDLSAAAARMLGIVQSGVAPVRLEVLNNQPSARSAR